MANKTNPPADAGTLARAHLARFAEFQALRSDDRRGAPWPVAIESARLLGLAVRELEELRPRVRRLEAGNAELLAALDARRRKAPAGSAVAPGLLDLASPERVGEDLARALASLLCRRLAHADGAAPCPACARAGRALAPAVGRALVASRFGPADRRGGSPALAVKDYVAIGQSLERLERVAGTVDSTERPRP